MFRLLTIVAFFSSLLLAACAAHNPDRDIVQAQHSSSGVSIYQTYCANCHGSFARTTKAHTSVKRLRSAIGYFPAMRNLDFLTDRQLEDIASALATVNLQQASRSDLQE